MALVRETIERLVMMAPGLGFHRSEQSARRCQDLAIAMPAAGYHAQSSAAGEILQAVFQEKLQECAPPIWVIIKGE
jgi:hypothetical protein